MIEAFSTGFYNKLKSNATLQTKLGGTALDSKIYNTFAKQDAVLPYITFGLLSDVPMADFADPATIEDMTFYLNVFSAKSPEETLEIADLVKAAMDNQVLTIAGYTTMRCMREYTGSVIWNADTKVFQISMRYRVQGCKT